MLVQTNASIYTTNINMYFQNIMSDLLSDDFIEGADGGADTRGSCPASHKYAYFNGDYCCHYNREKNSGEVNHDYIPLCYFTHYLLLLLTLHVISR